MKKWVIPSVVRVAGLDFEVLLDPIKCADNKVCGMTSNKTQQIWLDPTMKVDMIRVTFLHEVMHAICYQYGITNLIDEKMEEMVVNALSNGVFDIVRDGVVKF